MENQEMTKEEKRAILQWTMGLGDLNKVLFGDGSPLPDKSIKATAESWQIKPMSSRNIVIPVNITMSADLMEIVRQGHTPEEMEDHWFMYCDDNCIRYYRSWTGACIFEAYYKRTRNGYKIDKLVASRDSEEYDEINPMADVALFQILITTEVGGYPEAAWESYFLAKGL